MSPNLGVASSNPQVRRLKALVARLKARVSRLKSRVELIRPRVQLQIFDLKGKLSEFKRIYLLSLYVNFTA